MNTAAHTPGPWHYQEGSDAYTHIVRTGEVSRHNPHVGRRFLCQLPQDPDGTSEANARLIAAAPDLLAVALGYEAWEADVIMNNGWNGKDGLPTLTAAQYDEMMRLQGQRNEALGKALCSRAIPSQNRVEKSS